MNNSDCQISVCVCMYVYVCLYVCLSVCLCGFPDLLSVWCFVSRPGTGRDWNLVLLVAASACTDSILVTFSLLWQTPWESGRSWRLAVLSVMWLVLIFMNQEAKRALASLCPSKPHFQWPVFTSHTGSTLPKQCHMLGNRCANTCPRGTFQTQTKRQQWGKVQWRKAGLGCGYGVWYWDTKRICGI